jgi:hypothetical protein
MSLRGVERALGYGFRCEGILKAFSHRFLNQAEDKRFFEMLHDPEKSLRETCEIMVTAIRRSARKSAPKSYESMYPNLPPLPARRPSRKASSLFWRLGIWKREWGEPPMVVSPVEKPPIEFEDLIEELGFWREDWGEPPSRRRKTKQKGS